MLCLCYKIIIKVDWVDNFLFHGYICASYPDRGFKSFWSQMRTSHKCCSIILFYLKLFLLFDCDGKEWLWHQHDVFPKKASYYPIPHFKSRRAVAIYDVTIVLINLGDVTNFSNYTLILTDRCALSHVILLLFCFSMTYLVCDR